MRKALPSLLCAILVWTTVAALPAEAADSRAAFFDKIASLCGAVFEGYSSFPNDPEDSFAGKLLVATVASCTDDEIRIPFWVGENKSRTWILTRTSEALLLKHDHRHEDGTPDEITMYGGWATAEGTPTSQSFPADAHTKQLIPAAATNLWTLSLSKDARALTYDLQRNSEPRFRATLSRR